MHALGWLFLIGIVIISNQGDGADPYYLPLGCYTEDPTDQDLDGEIHEKNNITWTWCAKKCQSDGYAYAGIQLAKFCHCGNTYSKHGWSAGCRQTECSVVDPDDPENKKYLACGGTNANFILYSVNSDPLARMYRELEVYKTPKNFIDARRHCVAQDGDLPVIKAKKFIASQSTSIGPITQMLTEKEFWIGMTLYDGGIDFTWVDPTETGMAGTELYRMWENAASTERCVVLLNTELGGDDNWKFKKVACTEERAFICKQQPRADVNETTSPVSPDGEDDWLKANAKTIIYAVLPIFFIVFIGSCVIYIIGKSYKYCKTDPHQFSDIETDKDGRPLTSRDVAMESGGSPPPPYYRAASRGRKSDEQPLVPSYSNESEVPKRYPGRAKIYKHEQEEQPPNEFAIDFSKLSIQDIIYIKSLMGERRPIPQPAPGKKKRKIIMA